MLEVIIDPGLRRFAPYPGLSIFNPFRGCGWVSGKKEYRSQDIEFRLFRIIYGSEIIISGLCLGSGAKGAFGALDVLGIKE